MAGRGLCTADQRDAGQHDGGGVGFEEGSFDVEAVLQEDEGTGGV